MHPLCMCVCACIHESVLFTSIFRVVGFPQMYSNPYMHTNEPPKADLKLSVQRKHFLSDGHHFRISNYFLFVCFILFLHGSPIGLYCELIQVL